MRAKGGQLFLNSYPAFSEHHFSNHHMSTKDQIKIRVQIDSQTKFVVPCSSEWTIQKLKEEIEQRYQKILNLQKRIVISKLSVPNSFRVLSRDGKFLV
jgi:hypothetical protein